MGNGNTKAVKNTACLVILDRSGSMHSIKNEIEKGLNSMAASQARLPGHVSFDLLTFDTELEYRYEDVDAARARFSIDPRGGTALYDAIVSGCNQFTRKLASRIVTPDKVMVVVATDGEENQSKLADALLVRDTIAFKTTRFNWDFSFLGSDDEGIKAAAALGFEGKKTMKFKNSASGVAGMSDSLSAYLTATRSGQDAGYDDAARAKSAH